MAFIVNATAATDLDDSLIQAFDASYILAVGQENVCEQFATTKIDIGATSITINKVARLAPATTPLDEQEVAPRQKLVDSKIVITPAEYGTTVSTTRLANLQTGGKADLMAAESVGVSHGQTLDYLAIAALEASTNSLVIASKAEADVLATDVATGAFLNTFYNKLARKNVPKVGGLYIMVAPEDVIKDLRADSTWINANVYSNAVALLKNEMGMFAGFRVVMDNNILPADQGGAGTVDIYSAYFFGTNALAKATSQTGRMILKDSGDPMDRFFNLSWYEVSKYQILDQDCLWKGRVASSVGANA